MSICNASRIAICALALGSIAGFDSAYAQSAPFTIRRLQDGAVIREKRAIEIPRGSLKPGSVVAFFIDGKFITALSPEDQPGKSKSSTFSYIWDTKATGAEDGEHTIRAELYEPVGDTASNAMETKGHSEVKVIVQNKINENPGPIFLRYRYNEGDMLNYSRHGRVVVVSSVSGLQATDDMELARSRGKLVLDIQDTGPQVSLERNKLQVSLVRNKLTALTVEQGGQETRIDPLQLTGSMYQELDSMGRVRYETGTAASLQEFNALGIPVDNTLQLPLLPGSRVSIGDTWITPNQRLEIPGMPPALQPRVNLENKFEGLEWENKYQCAKIVQTYEGPQSAIQFGTIEVTSPTVKFERTIYLAYVAGLLVKTSTTLTVSGRTSSPINAPSPTLARGGASGFGPPPGIGGPGGPGGPPAAAMAAMMGQFRGGPPGGVGGQSNGPPAAAMAAMMGQFRGGPGRGGRGAPARGGRGLPGLGSGGGVPGAAIPGRSGFPGASGFPGRIGGSPGIAAPQETDRPITMKAITTTQLIR